MRLKELRVKKGLRQCDVADLLNITRASYSNIENEKRDPDTKTLTALSAFYGVSINYILGMPEASEMNQAAPVTEDSLIAEVTSLMESLPDSQRQQALSYIRFLASGAGNK